MSERFEVLFYGDVINCVRDETGKEYNLQELIDLLMNQQATINELKAKLREKEEDERLYANEILELRETNKEWLQCKNLGGDY